MSENDWSVDFVQQLRSIHFRLVAVSLVFTVLSITNSFKNVEVFGIPITANAIISFGTVGLVAIQFHFWLYLHEFNRWIGHTSPRRSVAWIGVFNSGIAIFATILSSCALPVFALILLYVGNTEANMRTYSIFMRGLNHCALVNWTLASCGYCGTIVAVASKFTSRSCRLAIIAARTVQSRQKRGLAKSGVCQTAAS